jgi:hypothetical protein
MMLGRKMFLEIETRGLVDVFVGCSVGIRRLGKKDRNTFDFHLNFPMPYLFIKSTDPCRTTYKRLKHHRQRIFLQKSDFFEQPNNPFSFFSVVCSDEASGRHYGSVTCFGCKGNYQLSFSLIIPTFQASSDEPFAPTKSTNAATMADVKSIKWAETSADHVDSTNAWKWEWSRMLFDQTATRQDVKRIRAEVPIRLALPSQHVETNRWTREM